MRDMGADLRAVNPLLKGKCQAFESYSFFFFISPPFLRFLSVLTPSFLINNHDTVAVVWMFVFSEYL